MKDIITKKTWRRIEDLAVDDILSIAYDEDGTVISVQVMNQAEETETES